MTIRQYMQRLWANLRKGHACEPAANRRLRILFVCTGNACRSQMAEGWTRALKSNRIEPFSAGTAPAGVDPLAVQVMAEAGVDISRQFSKHVLSFRDVPMDCVITLCDNASQACPAPMLAARTLHVGFDDPPTLARAAAGRQEALAHYRRVRDEIRQFVAGLPEGIARQRADAAEARRH
jgi:arsenate reductase